MLQWIMAPRAPTGTLAQIKLIPLARTLTFTFAWRAVSYAISAWLLLASSLQMLCRTLACRGEERPDVSACHIADLSVANPVATG